ncbi:uncharacterized protein PHALS_09647 [Plasmopara halstedii]|uniref:Uncharacterized protein n=1 Tax=Plasmopara halstedii TaxID=4781 RepID=A0A0P1AEB8_PLAHL|nr:uncharacterized protein PHALS_09647 [Plasmopara halstedii]CEG39396.1 hypothetical protein PHALS_09647 [Plasmopara halstedii]|eukprot:XP_024575765.1 hypothetical protein PHALS_09647 [Plasmopara halstedii]
MLQGGENVHVLGEERGPSVNVEGAVKIMSESKVVSPSVWARMKTYIQNVILCSKLLWSGLALVFYSPEKLLALGYTPGRMVSILKKADPEFTITKGYLEKGELVHPLKLFVNLNKQYKQLLTDGGDLSTVSELLHHMSKTKKKLSWITRLLAHMKMIKTSRILEKGLSPEKLLDLNISPYLYLEWVVKKIGDIPSDPKLHGTWASTTEAKKWFKCVELYEEKFSVSKKFSD